MRHRQVVQQCRWSNNVFDPADTLQCFHTAAQFNVPVASTVQITALLSNTVPDGESIQIGQAGIKGPLLLYCRSHNTSRANNSCQMLQYLCSIKIRNKRHTKPCGMTEPTPARPTQFSTIWMPHDGKCSIILHTAQLRYQTIFTSLDQHSKSPQKLYFHLRWQCAGDCVTVVCTAAQECFAESINRLLLQSDSCLNACGNLLPHHHLQASSKSFQLCRSHK